MAHHNTVLAQLMKMVPRHEFEKLANAVDGRRRATGLSRWSQFTALSVGHLGGRTSLRDIEATLLSQQHQRYHLGCQPVSKSSLARANATLDYRLFEQLFQRLYQRCSQVTPKHPFRFKHKLFSLDASFIDVSMKVFPWANFNTMKAAFKLHVGLDHDGLIPAFAAVTGADQSDTRQARTFDVPKGSVLVFDKGYSDYGWHKQLTDQGIFFVTRMRGNARYTVLERHEARAQAGVTSDQLIQFTSVRSRQKALYPVRRIGYRDADTGRHYVFITNQLSWSATTVAQIYKQRWQVELFFKWIKQNLKIKAFLGTSTNAVMTQILVALCLYLLLAYLKYRSKLTASLQQILRLLQLNLFIRRDLISLLRPGEPLPGPPPQLALALARR